MARKKNISSEEINNNQEELNGNFETNNIIQEEQESEIVIENNNVSQEILKSNKYYEEISSVIGDKLISKDSEIFKPSQLLPTGLDLLDKLLGGGLACGYVLLVGNPGAGKSALAAKFIATGQKKWGEKFTAIYIDTEQSITDDRLKQLGCIYKIPIVNNDISIEKVFNIINNLCEYKKDQSLTKYPSIVVWDSVANTLTEKMIEEDDVESMLAQKARVLNDLVPKYIRKLIECRISFVCINQLRENISMGFRGAGRENPLRFLSDKNLPGGLSLKFNCIQGMIVRQGKEVDNYGFEGIRVHIKTFKNKLFFPNKEIVTIFNYNSGYLNFWTNYEFLKEKGYISINGPWASMRGYPHTNCHQKQLINKYREDPEFKRVWNENLREAIKTEFEEKIEYNNIDIWEKNGDSS